jgi:flagellar hook assembly protein FlgD
MIYNLLGQRIRTLVHQVQNAGSYTALWDGKNNFGTPVASGVYLYNLTAGKFKQSRKMMLLR